MVYVALFSLNFPFSISILQCVITLFDVLPTTKLGKILFEFNDELNDDDAFNSAFRRADIF